MAYFRGKIIGCEPSSPILNPFGRPWEEPGVPWPPDDGDDGGTVARGEGGGGATVWHGPRGAGAPPPARWRSYTLFC